MPAIMIGIGKPGDSRSMPPPPDDDDMPGGAQDAEPDGDEGDGAKMSPAKALVSHADENCGNCSNYHGEDGSCEEVSGQFDPTDRCWAAYSASGTGEPQQNEDGTMPPPPDGSDNSQ
jgi:hypothetical protein